MKKWYVLGANSDKAVVVSEDAMPEGVTAYSKANGYTTAIGPFTNEQSATRVATTKIKPKGSDGHKVFG